jgi:hypothetical protein
VDIPLSFLTCRDVGCAIKPGGGPESPKNGKDGNTCNFSHQVDIVRFAIDHL